MTHLLLSISYKIVGVVIIILFLFIINGRESDCIFPANSLNNVTLIEVKQNSGHCDGAKELRLASFDYITPEFDYTIFILSFFGAFDENLILETLA